MPALPEIEIASLTLAMTTEGRYQSCQNVAITRSAVPQQPACLPFLLLFFDPSEFQYDTFGIRTVNCCDTLLLFPGEIAAEKQSSYVRSNSIPGTQAHPWRSSAFDI